MAKYVLAADYTLMTDYRNVPLATFFSCIPTDYWHSRLVFRILADPPKLDPEGRPIRVPYGLRKVEASLVRATGGGSKLDWWLQLHADVSGVPFEVVAQDEPGAFGAAILAGVGAGIYPSVSSAVGRLVVVSRRFEPDAERAGLYAALRRRLAARE